jgi:hypothetical protein
VGQFATRIKRTIATRGTYIGENSKEGMNSKQEM